MADDLKHLVLVGGGHAHVAVLADWIKRGRPCQRATLLTPNRHLRYSGMVPGWIAGRYERDVARVDLASLAERAGVQLLLGSCTEVEPDANWIKTGGGQVLEYDIASFDTGGVGRAHRLLGKDKRLIDIRPIDRFVEHLEERRDAKNIAVIGGGAGGVEIAFALRNTEALRGAAQVTLVTGQGGLLPNLSSAVRGKVAAELAGQGIALVPEDALLEDGVLFTGSERFDEIELIVAAMGSGAPDWPRKGGLSTDSAGFIAVDQHQRSLSHPNVFATGDVASRQDRDVAHSGVHAVMAGPHLAKNLRAVLKGRPPSAVYSPRWTSLYLLSTSNGSAILSYGPVAIQGRWVAKLKHWIDNRWISKYAAMSKPV